MARKSKPAASPFEHIMREADAPGASEHAIQKCYFAALARMANETGRVEYGSIFAVPNGGERDKITAARMVAEGVRRGAPDVILPFPCGKYYMGALEFKTREAYALTDSNLSEDQIGYAQFIIGQGGFWECVCDWRVALGLTIKFVGGLLPADYVSDIYVSAMQRRFSK